MAASSTQRTEICTSFSSVLPPNQISRCYDANMQSNINIFPPLQPDGDDDQFFVCIDSYSFTLKIFPPYYDPLAQKISDAHSGQLCVTMMRKPEDDYEQELLTKFECIYPNNVINGTNSGRIKDVILADFDYNIMTDDKWRLTSPGTLTLRNSNIRHPIYYPLPKDMYNDIECQQVTFNAYIRPRSTYHDDKYTALFDTTTGRPSTILIDSFIKIRVCNLAYIQGTSSRAENSEKMTMYLRGSCDTREYVSHTEYPFKLKFPYVGADSSDSSVITRTDLQLDPAKVWEVAVQSITYNISDKIMIPSPSWAKHQGIYDLYAGEILVSGPEFYPVGHDQNSTSTIGQDIHDIINNIHKVPSADRTKIRRFTSQIYGHFLECRRQLTELFQINSPQKESKLNLWYTNDLMETYDATSTVIRSPIFRWNYTDVMYAKYPARYTSNNGKFGLFTLKEIVTVEFISENQKVNAQKWAVSTAASGHSPLVGYVSQHTVIDPHGWHRSWYRDIRNGLPTLELLDDTVQKDDPLVREYSVRIKPQYTTKYIAVGAKIRKMFGYTVCGMTPPLKSATAPYPAKRGQLEIIYNNERESFITPCSLTSFTTIRGYTRYGVITKGHDVATAGLWSLPCLDFYSDDGHEYVGLPVKPKKVYSSRCINSAGGDEILIYSNILPNATHIGDNLAPLLVRAPCPTYKFGASRMYDGVWTVQQRTWRIENLEYKTILPNINLDDMYVTVSNSFGDVLYTGVLELQLIIREKNSSDAGAVC